jgi:hypothetical protein
LLAPSRRDYNKLQLHKKLVEEVDPQARVMVQTLDRYESTGWVTTHGKKARSEEAQHQRAALQRYSL